MGKSAPAPDNSAVIAAQASAQAAQEQYQLGEDQLNWAQTQWNQEQPLISEVTNADAAGQNQANTFAGQQQNLFNTTFEPLEQQYAKAASTYDSPSQEAVNAGAAEANVSTSMEAQRNAAQTQLESFGVDPTSTRYAALDYGTRAMQGAAMAGAGTTAIQQTKLQGLGLENSAIQTGEGLANSTAGLLNAGTGAGGTAASSTEGNLTAGSNAMTGSTAFTNAGTNAMNTDVNAVNGFNTAQEQGFATSQAGATGMGSALGGIFGALMPSNGIAGLASMAALRRGGPVQRTALALGGPSQPTGQTPGGAVPITASPTLGKASDDVPANLTAGEFVMPKDVVDWKGQEYFAKQIDGARKAAIQFNQRSDIGGQPSKPLPNAGAPTFVSRPSAIPMRRAA